MQTSGHQKHALLTKPQGGQYHRYEFALLGAPCGKIEQLVDGIQQHLGPSTRIGYVDAKHQAVAPEKPNLHRHLIDKIAFRQVNLHGDQHTHLYRPLLSETDFMLINGNHFVARQQVVLLSSAKKESLRRKLDRLGEVIAFVQDDEEVYDFLREAIPHWADLPLFPLHDPAALADFLQQAVRPAPIKGLVLAGGKSQRMGRDKGAISYHGKAQREHMADLLSELTEETYLSVAPGTQVESQYPLLEDRFLGLGPFGGLLTAFQRDPNAAWLVVACDQPLLQQRHLRLLLEQRETYRVATCFHNPDTRFPEPLMTLWEPKAYSVLSQFLTRGYSCLRKVLINASVREIEVEDHSFMLNVNTPEEYRSLTVRR
ncbi:MAG: NTP transferase domain-containing protein [Bacteroidota bacterium]